MPEKDVFTTGEVARICNVAPRTVSKWFDSGQLRGYRIPGSKDRRIPRTQLVRFMRAHSIPMGDLQSGLTRVLIIDGDVRLAELLKETLGNNGDYSVTVAPSAFEAGLAVGTDPPRILVVDVTAPDVIPREIARTVRTRPDLSDVKLVAISGGLSKGQGEGLLQNGFDAFLRKPFEIGELAGVLQKLLGPE